MITAVDTNVLLDVLDRDAVFMGRSLDLLRACEAEGGLIACEIVWAEIASKLPSGKEAALEVLNRVGIGFSQMSLEAALAAGETWRAYRRRGGPRERVVADFLIGAHAITQADRLLTRYGRFHRSYYTDLEVLDPGDF